MQLGGRRLTKPALLALPLLTTACASTQPLSRGEKAFYAAAGCFSGASAGASLAYAYSASYDASHASSYSYSGSSVDYRGNVLLGSLLGLAATCLPMLVWAATDDSSESNAQTNSLTVYERERLARLERLEQRLDDREAQLRERDARAQGQHDKRDDHSPRETEEPLNATVAPPSAEPPPGSHTPAPAVDTPRHTIDFPNEPPARSEYTGDDLFE